GDGFRSGLHLRLRRRREGDCHRDRGDLRGRRRGGGRRVGRGRGFGGRLRVGVGGGRVVGCFATRATCQRCHEQQGSEGGGGFHDGFSSIWLREWSGERHPAVRSRPVPAPGE